MLCGVCRAHGEKCSHVDEKDERCKNQLFAVVFAVPMVKNAVMWTKKVNGARLQLFAMVFA